jgi:hypothetical protein
MGMVDFLLVGAERATVYVNPSRVNYIRPTDSADTHTIIFFDKDNSIVVDHTPGDVARALSAP